MSLRNIVPTLGVLALATTATTQAVETGDLTIGGFVDATLLYEASDATGSTGSDDNIMQFAAEVELQFGYNIGDKVSAQVDIEFGSARSSRTYDVGGDDVTVSGLVYVEQANVAWAINDTVTVTIGAMETLIGYEAVDSPDLWRVGKSLVNATNPGSFAGVIASITPDADSETGIQADIYIANGGMYNDVASASSIALSDDLSFGLSVTYTAENFFVDFDFLSDASAFAAEESATLIGVNGEYVLLDTKLTLFADIQSLSWDLVASDDSVLSILIGANYQINSKMSATFMYSMADLDTNGAGGTNSEIALALLTNPTEDPNFALNFELELTMADDASGIGSYYSGDDIVNTNGGEDATAFVVEFLAVIP